MNEKENKNKKVKTRLRTKNVLEGNKIVNHAMERKGESARGTLFPMNASVLNISAEDERKQSCQLEFHSQDVSREELLHPH